MDMRQEEGQMTIGRGIRIGWLAGTDMDRVPLNMGETVSLPGCAGLLYYNERDHIIVLLFIIAPKAIASGIHFRAPNGPAAGAFMVKPEERFVITRDGRDTVYDYLPEPLEIMAPESVRCDFCHAWNNVWVLIQKTGVSLSGTDARRLCRDCAAVFGNYRK
jgi:hypothetical protein